MSQRTGLEQRRLRRITVQWGPQTREHLAVVPLFDAGYKVLGVVGLDADTEPMWYPGPPLIVEPRRLVFKSSLSDASPAWDEVPEGMLEGCYFHDAWGAVQVLVPQLPGAPSLRDSVNLAGNRIQGRPIQDVIFEPPLHRVRAFLLRRRWGRAQPVSVLMLPPLAQCLERSAVPPLDLSAMVPPPPRPEGRIDRVLRAIVGMAAPRSTRER